MAVLCGMKGNTVFE